MTFAFPSCTSSQLAIKIAFRQKVHFSPLNMDTKILIGGKKSTICLTFKYTDISVILVRTRLPVYNREKYI